MSESENNERNIDEIRERLVNSSVSHAKDTTDVQIIGYYYRKYGIYQLAFQFTDSITNFTLGDVPLSSGRIYEKLREPHRLAVLELDRILRTHYRMEELLRICQSKVDEETASMILDLLNEKGREE